MSDPPGPGCVTGRFQPVHGDHLRLMRRALDERGALVVAITNPDPGSRHADPRSAHRHRDDANPLTYWQRAELLRAALAAPAPDGLGPGAAAEVRIVPFDLGRPEHWAGYVPLEAVQYVGVAGDWEREKARRLAGAGYRVREVTPPPWPRRSGTAIRAAMRGGGDWEAMVPPATVAPLRALLAGGAFT
ncbi:MAG: cytidyltransferase [Thermoleophilia bacterium]